MKQQIILLAICLFFTSFLSAQFVIEKPEIQDSSYTIPLITLSYARQWSGSDLSSRFGANNNVGVNFLVKSKSNWIYGVKANFLWGGKVQNSNMLDGIKTSNDEVIDDEGRVGSIFLGQRGSSAFIVGGKFFNVLSPNKNSGIIAYGGFGYLQHKISIKFKDEIAPLSDDLKKGYDRYSMGYAVNSFVGYLFLSKNRLLNFYGGFDYTFARTKSLRKYNYDTNMPDTETNTDVLYGFRVGWIIRLNKRQADSFYYN